MAEVTLTPALQSSITAFIRAGAFADVAAEASGVPVGLFHHWLQIGKKRRGPRKYRLFRQAVHTAQAQARVKAEMTCLQDDPKTWLTKGPGKETPERPGWSGVVKPLLAVSDNRTVNLLADPGSAALIQLLLAALSPYPEARKAAIAAMNGSPGPPGLPGSPKAVRALPGPSGTILDATRGTPAKGGTDETEAGSATEGTTATAGNLPPE